MAQRTSSPGCKAAYDDLVHNPATLRHIILITDGWSTHGAYDDAARPTCARPGSPCRPSAPAAGRRSILRRLAEESGGRYYDAADATTIPDIFLRETIRTAGERIVEETFQPIPSASSEILEGLDAGRLPQLLGYNATTAKGSATVSLLTAREDPLLAQWQYGLGRAVAWTSDAREQWAAPWIGTAEFGTLTAQLVAWTLPPQDAEGIDVRFTPAGGGELDVEVTSFDDDGAPRNFYRTVLRLVSPDLEPIQAELEQVGPGRYAGTVRADDPGAYLVRVAQTYEDEERNRCGQPDARHRLARGRGVPPPRGRHRCAGRVRRRPAADVSCRSTRTSPAPRSGVTTSPRAPSRRRSGRGCSCSRSCSSRSTSACVASRSPAPTLRGRGHRSPAGWAWEPMSRPLPGLGELRAARERGERRAGRAAVPSNEPTAPVAAAVSPPAGSSSDAAARRPAPTAPVAPEVPSGAGGETLAERLARRRRGG